MSDLEVQGLVKRFGNNVVVDHVNFKVRDGEFFVLLGPSGGGKTTVLRMVCGLEQPDEGRILLNNNDITRLQPRQRNLGMVFQDYGLYPTMDVFGNIAYGLETRHVARAEIEKRVKLASEMLGLDKMLKRPIQDLSGGEQQRVALCRAIVKDAEAYLFDEPLSNLDPKLRYQARRDIVTVHRAKQKPSVYVTHDQSEAFSMADRIAVVAKGKIQQIGTPDDLLHTPSNLFMARFVGSPPMNTLPAHVQQENGSYRLRTEAIDVLLPEKWNQAIEQQTSSDVMVGIRPSAIVPEWAFEHLDDEPEHTFKAEITDIEPLVGEIIVTLQLADATTLTAVFEETNDDLFDVGQTITATVDSQQLCLFDPATEQALKVSLPLA